LTDTDVIIVGGGPSGSTAARRLAQAGISVTLLDKAVFPRQKPCAGAIRNEVSAALDFDISGVIQRKISGLAIVSPSGIRVDCIPEDRSKPGHTIMREDFDHLLLKKAEEAGAVVQEQCKVVEVSQDSAGVTVKTEDGREIRGRFLVGADGINSIVAKQLGFYERWSSDSAMVAIEIEAEVGAEKVHEICRDPTGYDADIFFLYFGDVPHGYTWCFPKKMHLSLGICCRQDKAKNIRAAYQRWYERFADEHQIEPKIVSDSAARFPVRPSPTLMRGRTLLVGDAAGFVDSFTGEGIPYAIRSGIAAAEALTRAVEKNDTRGLQRYVELCKKNILKDLKVSDSMAKMFYKSTKNMETLCRFFRDDSYASYLIAASIGGLLPMGTVKRKLTLRMLRKRPRDAISLVR